MMEKEELKNHVAKLSDVLIHELGVYISQITGKKLLHSEFICITLSTMITIINASFKIVSKENPETKPMNDEFLQGLEKYISTSVIVEKSEIF